MSSLQGGLAWPLEVSGTLAGSPQGSGVEACDPTASHGQHLRRSCVQPRCGASLRSCMPPPLCAASLVQSDPAVGKLRPALDSDE